MTGKKMADVKVKGVAVFTVEKMADVRFRVEPALLGTRWRM